MRIKAYLYLLIFGLFFGSSYIVKAQDGYTTFTDGITVAIKTEAKPPIPEGQPLGITGGEISSSFNGKDVIHRVLVDTKNKWYFGYDLEVSELPDSRRFKVVFKPLSISPDKITKSNNLTAVAPNKYPEEMIVEDGDTIFFDTFENPQTKAILSDLIKVTRQSRVFGSYFTEREPAKDFTINDVQMQFTNLEAFINDKKVGQVRGIAGANLSFYFQGKGRFIVSLFPKKDFNLQKIGVIEDNKLFFTFNGENYKFVSSSPIVGTGGKWNVWVLYDPDYKSFSNSPHEFGAGDSLESFLKRKT